MRLRLCLTVFGERCVWLHASDGLEAVLKKVLELLPGLLNTRTLLEGFASMTLKPQFGIPCFLSGADDSVLLFI